MIKTFVFLTFLLLNQFVFSQKAYTPEKGSNERTEILNIFREDFEEKSSILFRIEHLLVKNNWACALVLPLKDGQEYGEPRWGLLKKSNGKWSQLNWSDGIEINDDFELIDLSIQKSRIARLIVEKYPSCPMDIFGN